MKAEELVNLFTSRCKVYDLEHVRYDGMPTFDTVKPGLLYFLHRQHENYYRPSTNGPRTASSGIIIMSDHSGTHIDAKCHQSSELTLSNGVKVNQDVETPWGFSRLGAENINPVITRGVLVDVAKFAVNPLTARSEISLDQFRMTLEAEKVEIMKNDVVLIRTGYGRYWNAPEKYREAPGVSKDVSLWLRDREVFAVGADNLSWDSPDYVDPVSKSNLPAHLFLLAEKGIHIIENVNLETLSADKGYTHMFIGLPLKFKGATGSPMRPIAVVPIE